MADQKTDIEQLLNEAQRVTGKDKETRGDVLTAIALLRLVEAVNRTNSGLDKLAYKLDQLIGSAKTAAKT
jgi:hypothetical protein